MKSIGGVMINKDSLKYSEKNLPHCYFSNNKSHIDCQGIEPRLPWREDGKNLLSYSKAKIILFLK